MTDPRVADTLDVVILAGGAGSRLKGAFDGPKCLAPVAGKPLLMRLIESCKPLPVRQVVLMLGFRAYDVMISLTEVASFGRPWFDFPVTIHVEKEFAGTAATLRLAGTVARCPFLLLNGDTLPLYPLSALVDYWRAKDCPAIAAAWKDGYYAGASIWGNTNSVAQKEDINDLNYFMGMADRYQVPGYLDIGTPETFEKAQQMKEEDICFGL